MKTAVEWLQDCLTEQYPNGSFVWNTKADLEAFTVDVYGNDLSDNIELNDVGYLIAMTGSEAVNEFAVKSFSKAFGEQGSYRLATSKEILKPILEDQNKFFTPKDDYINLSEAYRDNPKIYEVAITSEEEYRAMLSKLFNEVKSIPLFVKKEDKLFLLPEFEKLEENKDNCTLIYLGKTLVLQEK